MSHFGDCCVHRLFFRYERLEEQLNDLTELHQNEMTNLKQELASMEEKVAYQSYERARDIQVKNPSLEVLKTCLQMSQNTFSTVSDIRNKK